MFVITGSGSLASILGGINLYTTGVTILDNKVDEINPPMGVDLTNLLLLELLQKQGEQLQQQNEYLKKLMEAKEKKIEEINSYMFKRFSSHNPPIYDGTPDPKAFKDWIRGVEKLFVAL